MYFLYVHFIYFTFQILPVPLFNVLGSLFLFDHQIRFTFRYPSDLFSGRHFSFELLNEIKWEQN